MSNQVKANSYPYSTLSSMQTASTSYVSSFNSFPFSSISQSINSPGFFGVTKDPGIWENKPKEVVENKSDKLKRWLEVTT